jgi:hypothetical protein
MGDKYASTVSLGSGGLLEWLAQHDRLVAMTASSQLEPPAASFVRFGNENGFRE